MSDEQPPKWAMEAARSLLIHPDVKILPSSMSVVLRHETPAEWERHLARIIADAAPQRDMLDQAQQQEPADE